MKNQNYRLPTSFTTRKRHLLFSALFAASLFCSAIAQEALREAKGVISTHDGKSLKGIRVTVDGKPLKVKTNKRGEFTLSGVEATDSLMIRLGGRIGTIKMAVGSKPLNIIINKNELAVTDMAGTVNLGYVTVSSRNNTSASTTITRSEIERTHARTLVSLLSGRVPGLNLSTADADDPGETPSPGVMSSTTAGIRGDKSFRLSGEPLVVIDGMISGTLHEANRTVSIQDIDQVDVLKDGTSMYGARGSNGVIVITTGKKK